MAQVPKHTPGKHMTEETKSWFYQQVSLGKNPYDVGRMIGISRSTVRKLLLRLQSRFVDHDPVTLQPKEKLTASQVAERFAGGEEGSTSFPDPILDSSQLPNDRAVQAWHDFGYFRVRYLGRRHIAWQVEMCQILLAWWESGSSTEDSEGSEIIKGIINTPPGGGKTTTITHDFPAWCTGRNRDLRTGLGSRTSGQSTKYVRRLRTTFERNALFNMEFGRFKPLTPELWRQDQFTVDGVTGHEASIDYRLALAGFDPNDPRVRQKYEDPTDTIHEILTSLEGAFLTGEKEPTVSALSQDMGFLGGRYDLNLWDDLCDSRNSRTPEQRDGLTEWWFAEAESRCEPGGIVGLIGTRFGRYDLYRHCRDLTYTAEDDADEMLLDEASGTMSEETLSEIREDLEKELVDRYGKPYTDLATPDQDGMRRSRPVYRYHKFPAHDELKCEHPESLRNTDHVHCVLDPKRFNYRHLLKVQASDPRKFNLTYQQQDENTADNLVQKIWLSGGLDPKTNQSFPGCYNYDRRLLQIPDYLEREDCFSIGTVDPSAQNFWSIQWWIWDARHDRDYLVDLLRIRTTSGGFLDWNQNDRTYRGILNTWQSTSIEMGWPISLWIIEQSGAQRYLFQYRWVYDWMKLMKTMIKGHETNRNKADPDLGVEQLGPRYQLGLVDLPFDQSHLLTRVRVGEFAKELTEWPDSQTEDMVMGNWFLHFNRYTLPDSLRVSAVDRVIRHPYEDSMPDSVKVRLYDRKRGHGSVSSPPVGHREAQRRRAG